jgi:hypothetical protein
MGRTDHRPFLPVAVNPQKMPTQFAGDHQPRTSRRSAGKSLIERCTSFAHDMSLTLRSATAIRRYKYTLSLPLIAILVIACGKDAITDPIPKPGEDETRRTVQISLPSASGIDITTLDLTAGAHQAALTKNGNGIVNLDPTVATLLAASTPSGPVLLAIAQGSATQGISLSAQSTAEALAFLHPVLVTSSGAAAPSVLAAIRSSSQLSALTAAITSQLNTPGAITLEPDLTVATLLENVVADVVSRIGATNQLQPRRALITNGSVAGSGLRAQLLGPDQQGVYTVQVTNDFERWVRVVVSESSDGVAYTTSLSDNLSPAIGHRILRASESVNVPLKSAPAFHRVKGFGLGFSGSGEAFADPDRDYLWFPVVGQIVFEFVTPIVEVVAGVKGLGAHVGAQGPVAYRWMTAVQQCLISLPAGLDAAEEAMAGGRMWDMVKPIAACGLQVLRDDPVLSEDVLGLVLQTGVAATVSSILGPISLLFHAASIINSAENFALATAHVIASRALETFDIRNPAVSLSARLFASSVVVSALGNADPPSDLYRIEPYAFGHDIPIGRIRTIDGVQPAIYDVAMSASGTLWGVSSEAQLFSIDTSTGVAQLRATLNLPAGQLINSLTFDLQGRLLGATLPDGYVTTISTATGETTVIGQFQNGLGAWGDLAISATGELYASTISEAGDSRLVLLDPATFAATNVGSGTLGRFDKVWGLAFVGDKLIGLTASTSGPGSMVLIDKSLGTEAWLRRLSFNASGAAGARSISTAAQNHVSWFVPQP